MVMDIGTVMGATLSRGTWNIWEKHQSANRTNP